MKKHDFSGVGFIILLITFFWSSNDWMRDQKYENLILYIVLTIIGIGLIIFKRVDPLNRG